MSFLTTNYANTNSNSNEPLPAGEYEFIIKNVAENATASGAESMQFELVVRNDLDQALPQTNGKQHNRHIWVNEWKRRKTNQYDMNNFMYFMKAAGIPEGTAVNTIEDFENMMINKPVRLRIKVEKDTYNNDTHEVNRPAPWDWMPTKFPQVNHQWKQKTTSQSENKVFTANTDQPKPDNVPF